MTFFSEQFVEKQILYTKEQGASSTKKISSGNGNTKLSYFDALLKRNFIVRSSQCQKISRSLNVFEFESPTKVVSETFLASCSC